MPTSDWNVIFILVGGAHLKLLAHQMHFVKRILIASSILAVSFVAAYFIFWPRPIAADIYPNEVLTVEDTTRTYRIVIPHTLSKPAPIVFAFHGMGDSPESMANYSRLDKLASRYGFLLVYPAAEKTMWATSDVTPDRFDANPDVRFFDHLLIHLSNSYEIDRNRVYAVGMSNGASFIQLLAMARSKDIAAIAAHSGPKPPGLGSSEDPRPMMLIVGDDDPVASAMQSDADQYRSYGHIVKFVSIPGLAHEWSATHDREMWGFLSQYSLDAKP